MEDHLEAGEAVVAQGAVVQDAVLVKLFRVIQVQFAVSWCDQMEQYLDCN